MKNGVLIIGAGGHARVIADIVTRQESCLLMGFLDDNLVGDVNGAPVLGRIRDFPQVISSLQYPRVEVVIGIGDNQTRRDISLQLNPMLEDLHCTYATVVDPSAVVSPTAVLGKGTVVMPNAVINSGAVVGSHVILNTAATVDHDCLVDDFAHLSPGVHLAGNVHVGSGSHVGTGAVAIPGVKIGSWSVIGAGSTVVKDIPNNVLAYGVPARVMKSRV